MEENRRYGSHFGGRAVVPLLCKHEDIERRFAKVHETKVYAFPNTTYKSVRFTFCPLTNRL